MVAGKMCPSPSAENFSMRPYLETRSEQRSYWSTSGVLIKRGHLDTDTATQRGVHMKTEAEQEPSASHAMPRAGGQHHPGRQGEVARGLPQSSAGSMALPTPLPQTWCRRALEAEDGPGLAASTEGGGDRSHTPFKDRLYCRQIRQQ